MTLSFLGVEMYNAIENKEEGIYFNHAVDQIE